MPAQLHPNLSPDLAEAGRESWQRRIRESYQQGSRAERRRGAGPARHSSRCCCGELRAKGLIPHESLEGWALDRVETSNGTMTRLQAFLQLETAEEIYNATYDQLAAEEPSADPGLD